MEIEVKGLRGKKTAGGIRYYWEPNGPQRKAGWEPLKFGFDLVAAVKGSEARNLEIEGWRAGGAKPAAVKKIVKRQTFGAMLKAYREQRLPMLAASTQRTAKTPLDRLEAWAGDMPCGWVTRQRVRKLRDAIAPFDPETKTYGGLGHQAAFHVLEQGRTVCKWGEAEGWLESNPFTAFGLGKPPPRQIIWEDHHRQAFVDAAIALDPPLPSVALAIEIGLYIGQRQADVLKLSRSSWKPIPERKFRNRPDLYHQLLQDPAAIDPNGPNPGEVMGLYVRQGKTSRHVGIPIEGDMRRRIEAAIGANITSTAIVVCERTGQPWAQDNFQHNIVRVRDKAIELATKAGDADLAAELAVLQFKDLRRSCVVVLGELGLEPGNISGVTGHKLATIMSILETYMPRTEAMAAGAVVARLEDRRPPASEQEEQEKIA